MCCIIVQLPVNSSNLTTSHKLQELTKDKLGIYLLMEQIHKLDVWCIVKGENNWRIVSGKISQIWQCQIVIKSSSSIRGMNANTSKTNLNIIRQ